MSTQPKTIDDISRTKTTIDGTERVPGRDSSGDFKITITNLISSLQSLYIGQEMKFLNCYKPISASFPWYCMSLPDATLTTANFDAAFITEMRSRKVVYDELNTAVSSFSGTWSGSNFTLDNNAANVAMIAELYEDWLFAGSPTSGWRILVSGGTEYNITGFTVASRIITVSGSPSGTSIEIYLNRILGSTNSCKHFSWAGLGLYMTGQNKITGLRRRDKFQAWQLGATLSGVDYFSHAINVDQTQAAVGLANSTDIRNYTTTQGLSERYKAMSDGTNGTPRTGPKTEMESGTVLAYVFVGTYTA
jgi:hypothetical protein